MLCIKQCQSKSMAVIVTPKKLVVLCDFDNLKVEWTGFSALFSKNVRECFRATNVSGSNKSG